MVHFNIYEWKYLKKIPLKDGDLEMMDNVREDKRNMWLELKYILGKEKKYWTVRNHKRAKEWKDKRKRMIWKKGNRERKRERGKGNG